MKRKHTVHFVAQDKSADFALCVFCKRMTDNQQIGDCVYYADGYIGGACTGMFPVDNVADRLEHALEQYAK